jgi:hypothetical protein
MPRAIGSVNATKKEEMRHMRTSFRKGKRRGPVDRFPRDRLSCIRRQAFFCIPSTAADCQYRRLPSHGGIHRSITGRQGRQPKQATARLELARSRWSLVFVTKFTMFGISSTGLPCTNNPSTSAGPKKFTAASASFNCPTAKTRVAARRRPVPQSSPKRSRRLPPGRPGVRPAADSRAVRMQCKSLPCQEIKRISQSLRRTCAKRRRDAPRDRAGWQAGPASSAIGVRKAQKEPSDEDRSCGRAAPIEKQSGPHGPSPWQPCDCSLRSV